MIVLFIYGIFLFESERVGSQFMVDVCAMHGPHFELIMEITSWLCCDYFSVVLTLFISFIYKFWEQKKEGN